MRPSTGLTLQINSVEALERLVGEDQTLHTSIRQSVLTEFLKQVNTSLPKVIGSDSLRLQVEQEIRKTLVAENLVRITTGNIQITDKFRQILREAVETLWREMLHNTNTQLQQQITTGLEDLRAQIAAQVSRQVKQQYFKDVEDEVNKRLARLKQFLPEVPEEQRKIHVA